MHTGYAACKSLYVGEGTGWKFGEEKRKISMLTGYAACKNPAVLKELIYLFSAMPGFILKVVETK